MGISADLTGLTALVTGASSQGFGAHFGRTLARCGAEVVVAARRQAPLATLVEEIIGAGGKARAVCMDVSEMASVADGLDEAGALDIIVNNAGVEVNGPALGFTEEQYDYVLDVNLKGVWQVATEAARRMRDAKIQGSIINIASITGHRGMKGAAPYGIAKAGVIQLTRQLAIEVARFGIRVNSISPGFFITDLNRDFLTSAPGDEVRMRIAMRRFGRFSDLDGALLLLASPASAYMTGSDIVVDGGHLFNPL